MADTNPFVTLQLEWRIVTGTEWAAAHARLSATTRISQGRARSGFELEADARFLPVRVVRPEGLEPPAYRFEACRSIQLSYGRTSAGQRRV